MNVINPDYWYKLKGENIMSTSMSFDRAVHIACKTLMSAGNFTQDERAAAYDTLVSVNVQFKQMFKNMFPQMAENAHGTGDFVEGDHKTVLIKEPEVEMVNNIVELRGATKTMNYHGFFDGMKFEVITSRGNPYSDKKSRVSLCRHLRTGKLAWLTTDKLESVEMTKEKYDSLVEKRLAKVYKSEF